MIDKINQKIEDLREKIDRLRYHSITADKLEFKREVQFVESIIKERVDFRNFLSELVREKEEEELE